MRAAIFDPKPMAAHVAKALGGMIPIRILSVLLEKGEHSVEQRVVEAMAGGAGPYLVSVNTEQQAWAAHQRVEDIDAGRAA